MYVCVYVSWLVLQIACCDYHCAVVTESGRVFTFGSKENGKLGLGRDVPSTSVGHVTEVSKFYGTDERTLMPNVKIGYVSVYRSRSSDDYSSYPCDLRPCYCDLGELWSDVHSSYH